MDLISGNKIPILNITKSSKLLTNLLAESVNKVLLK